MRAVVVLVFAPCRNQMAGMARHREPGIKVERAMTDNGSRLSSRAFTKACVALGLKHIRTKHDTPKTNGKAERFIRSSLRERLLCANGPPGAPVRLHSEGKRCHLCMPRHAEIARHLCNDGGTQFGEAGICGQHRNR